MCYDVISIFSRWRPAAILDLMWVMLDHPRSAIVCIYQLGLQIWSWSDLIVGDLRFLYFAVLAWKLSIHAHFEGFGAIFLPNMVTHRSNPQKDHPCPETCRLSVKIDPAVRPGRRIEQTGQSKSHNVEIFRLFGEKPPLHGLKRKCAWWVISPT